MKDQDQNLPAPLPEDEGAIVPGDRGEFLLYQTADGRTINDHLRNIYDEGELEPEATIRKYRIVRREGSREVAREIEHYSLDAILAVGYRVRSRRGTQS